MRAIKANLLLDAKGLSCPMPIVKTKKSDEGFRSRASYGSASNR